jgi:hypothetical protein
MMGCFPMKEAGVNAVSEALPTNMDILYNLLLNFGLLISSSCVRHNIITHTRGKMNLPGLLITAINF